VANRNPWEAVLDHVREAVSAEDFRRWFLETSYASDSGDQITVWVPSETARRYIGVHFVEAIDEALAALDRENTQIRFVVSGTGEDDEHGEE
jgi:chromosomal replication initiation ATPase DnaA